MTFDIAFVLIVLAVALYLFVTEKLGMDIVALLVLGVIALVGIPRGLLNLDDALSGFSSPAVVTVWAMFILSAGLSATGVADVIGQQVLKMAGKSEPRIILVIMLTTGVLSAFMNNIGVAALMLPISMDIARRTKTPPARILMPMAYGSLLGGLTTLIGTPPNLVASGALRAAGIQGYSLFEFSLIGVPAMVGGSLFVAFIGRHLLPSKMPESFVRSMDEDGPHLQFAYQLEERRFQLVVGDNSPFDGMSLRETGLGSVLGLNVYAVARGQEHIVAIDGEFVLNAGDSLHVHGKVDHFREFLDWKALEMASGQEISELLSLQKVGIAEAGLHPESNLIGLAVRETDFQRRFHAHILTVKRGKSIIREKIRNLVFQEGDVVQLEGPSARLEPLKESKDFISFRMISEERIKDIYSASDSLLELDIPADSRLAGTTIAESGLSEALKLRVIGIARRPESIHFPPADEKFQPGDKLLVQGQKRSLKLMKALQSLELSEESEPVEAVDLEDGYIEVTLSPQSTLCGKSLRELDFRKRFGLQVQSVWRNGSAYSEHLRNLRLQFGDAMLLTGTRDAIDELGRNRDFLVLSQAAYREKIPLKKTILASVIMLAVVFPVLMNWVHISVAALTGAAVMVAAKCLTMEDGYRAIEWRSVFLIAGMMPLGVAMQTSGAAEWLATGVTSVVSPFGPWGLIIGLYVMTMLATTIIPTTALVLIMAPIAISTSETMGMDPRMIMMAIAMAASASFTSPISHPANVLVMGPGGYKFVDYMKLGVPLALIVMLIVLPLLAVFW